MSKFIFLLLLVLTVTACTPEETIVEEAEEVQELADETFVATNWDHIATSLTKYLIWEGEEVAMVENCPGGYSEVYGVGTGYYFCDDPYNRWLQFEWLDGREVRVPDEVGELFLWDRTNPGGSSFQQTMTKDEKYWLYVDTWSDDESQLISYNVKEGTQTVLMSFTAVDYSEAWCSGLRFFGWNESQTKLGILARNESDPVNYPEESKVFILTIEDGKLVQKSKYNLPVMPDCTPNNGPYFAVDWVDDDTIGYYDSNEALTYEDTEYFETLFWSDDPWSSEYAHFYDVQ
ncbi:hypothetical protein IPG41_02125 [Candidatus Peregrinibacteria bacterium]|nr:MAG: hypothetical protein IPG41_02125 [Candidatus Peregrinibacteria bacterium]